MDLLSNYTRSMDMDRLSNYTLVQVEQTYNVRTSNLCQVCRYAGGPGAEWVNVDDGAQCHRRCAKKCTRCFVFLLKTDPSDLCYYCTDITKPGFCEVCEKAGHDASPRCEMTNQCYHVRPDKKTETCARCTKRVPSDLGELHNDLFVCNDCDFREDDYPRCRTCDVAFFTGYVYEHNTLLYTNYCEDCFSNLHGTDDDD